MKRFLFFITLLFAFFFSNAQTTPVGTGYPILQTLGRDSVVVNAPGTVSGRIVIYRYADTTAANLERIKNYPFAFIGTTSDNLIWFRNAAATEWLQAGSNVTNITNIYEALTDCYGILSGGVVSWSQLLIFDVSPADYVINCDEYSSAQTQLTLTAAHATLNRIDVIYADTNGVVNYITGTPAADPAKPQVDPASQLELTSVLVLAAATTPSGFCQTVIYDENTEATGSATGVTVNFNNSTNPFHLTKAADVGTFTAGQSFKWTNATDYTLNDYFLLKFYIRLKATFSPSAMLRLDWLDGTTSVSSTVNLASGQFGFTRTTVGSYQIITIPLSAWSFTSANADALRVTMAGTNASGFYMDWVQLQCTPTQEPVVFPNGFGVIQTVSGSAVSTQPNDILNVVTTGNITSSASGKTLTLHGASTGSTVTILNDSTVIICDAQANCDTFIVSNVPIQQVFIVNDTTLLVCDVDGVVCDTLVIPTPTFFDRGFFDPDQASFATTFHTMNGNDLRLIGGTLDINDDGLAITTRSIITPLQAVNDHTDLNNVKIGVIAARRVAGNGAAGLGIGYRTDIDNDASTQTIAANMTTEWSAATAGSETATTKLWTVSGGTLASRFQIEGSTRIIANGVRLQDAKGSDVAAANDLTLGNGGNLFTITGNTTINAITTTNWQAGSNISFIFTGTPLVKNNTAGGAGTATMLLAGRVDFQAAAGDYIAFEYDGTNWYETNRKLAASSGTNTFSNYITESGGAVKLGGTGVDAVTTLTADEKQILMTFNSITSGTGLNITSTSTAAASSSQKLVAVNTSGANVNASQITYGLHVTNTHTGTSPRNIAIFGTVANGTSSGAGVYGEAQGIQTGVEGVSNSSGIGVEGTSSSGIGGEFTSTSGSGLVATSTTGLGANIFVNPSTTNTTVEVLRVERRTSATAANNIGASLTIYNEADDNFGYPSARIVSTLFDAAVATRKGTLTFDVYQDISPINRYSIYGNYTTLTEATATTILRVNVPSSEVAGGEILVTVQANDATEFQTRTLRFLWSAANKAGTTDVDISTPEEVVSISSGTLTATITAVDAGTGNVDFKVDATSSLTQTTLRASYQITKNFGTGAITAQ